MVTLIAVLWCASQSASPRAQQTDPCAPPNSNAIVCENQLPGNPASEWDVDGSGDLTIQGYTSEISVDQGQTVFFKIDTNAAAYRLDIYRMGYYGGMGARHVATVLPSVTLPQTQPECLNEVSTGLIDCGNWAISASWAVPSSATSGIYFAKATRLDTGGSSHIFFIVRNDDGHSALLFQTSDTTWQAYNDYGGNSLYVGNPIGRAYKVSYNRPFTTRGPTPQDWVFNAEYPMVRFLEANGYDVSYFTGVDSDRRGAEIAEHRVFLSVGHDEYWSGNQRMNVESARNGGVHLAFFSGNEVFWKTRWEDSIAGGSQAYRTLVTYKETHANDKIDPLPNIWTGTWRDPRFSPPGDGGQPENALTGNLFMVNRGSAALQVPAAEGRLRFWRNTPLATQPNGAVATLTDETIGFEWDEDADNGFRPAGIMRLSDTTVSNVEYLQDYGSTYAPATANHALTLHRRANGVLVFGAGTVQWSWGLDSNHDRGDAPATPAMQQATVNLFADMGVQPLTLLGGLTPATASTDVTPPSSAITSPTSGSSVPAASAVTITGTASDSGGAIAGVEVSVDGGLTWRRATGRASWTYTWNTGNPRVVTLLSRAVDDSGNVEQPGPGRQVTVGTGAVTCPCTIWNATEGPATPFALDPTPVEIGTRFRTDRAGYVTSLRFFKHAQNVGLHTGSLWTEGGTLLAQADFVNETPSGWQEVALSTPVVLDANTNYVVSYHSTSGYSADEFYFQSHSVDNGPLHAVADGQTTPNGVYLYGGSPVFPVATFRSTNYWVDLVFLDSLPADTTPPTVTSTTPASGATGVSANVSVRVVFSEAMAPSSITSSTIQLRTAGGALVPASVSFNASTRTATMTPSTPLAYSATYTARVVGGASGVRDLANNPLAADVQWSFTTSAEPPPPPTEGPGGPILVVSHTSNPYSRYYTEILRAEGLNSFSAMDLSQINATVLSAYDVVILGEMPLTAAQSDMFAAWVAAGGNLIAMRPDKQLAGLLGLVDAASTLAEGYLRIDTSRAPGAGIVADSMQFHGTADRYTVNGATTVAWLYTNATDATANPAVAIRANGGNGGEAATFTFDLARSIVQTRQGNPAWSGQERDGVPPIRSDDLFFGGTEPNWLDLSKVAVPQADEQQRLLANLVLYLSRDRKPLPRFWYFPRGEKAAVVMTGDDHANNGTPGRFELYKSASPVNCNVNDWECVRSTSYIYAETPIDPAQAAAYVAQGFEIAMHVSTGCADYTAASLAGIYASELNQFTTRFPGLPPARTNRTHCVPFSDYDTQPLVELANGIRLDTNYYYWPSSLVLDRPGFMTGSGMPMRFARPNGTMIDVYQAATQLTDESEQTWPFTIDTLLNRALGPEGYYGFFVANMHTDVAAHDGSQAIVSSALARSVPVISAEQLLTWTDGRNASSFGNLAWNGNTLTFTVAVGAGANGIEGMLPSGPGYGSLVSLSRNGAATTYRVEAIKGVTYAIFSALPGSYTATYASDTTPPVIGDVVAVPQGASATITWTTDEAASSRVAFGLSASQLTQVATAPGMSTSHSVSIVGLPSSTTHYYQVTSIDASGNQSTAPASPAAFTTLPASSLSCPCSIWPSTATPAISSIGDLNAVELGVKFRTTVSGFISGIRFYKGTPNTGAHVGSLWTATGAPLASKTFANESASGWQEVVFDSPVPVTANTVYVASYFAPSGGYAFDGAYFTSAGVVNGPLEAVRNDVAGGNGVYNYGPAPTFPALSYNSANYWVDVVFITNLPPDTTPPQVTATAPANGSAGAALTPVVTASFNEDMNAASISTSTVELRDGLGDLVPAIVSYDAGTRTARLSPTTSLFPLGQYTALVRGGAAGVRDASNNPLASDVVWSFTTTAAAGTALTDTTVADFSLGTLAGTVTVANNDGEVSLPPSQGSEFSTPGLPAGWSFEAWTPGGTATVSAGALTVDGARAVSETFAAPGQSLEFSATFGTESFRHVGWGITLNETPFAIFSTRGGGGELYARTASGGFSSDTLIPGNWTNGPHRFRIEWNAASIVYSIDGTPVATHVVAITDPMRPLVSDYAALNGGVIVDWVRVSPYAPTGVFTSRVLDGLETTTWESLAWTEQNGPAAVAIRFGDTPTPDGSWTTFTPAPASGAPVTGHSRYAQYRLVLSSSGATAPLVHDVTLRSVTPPLPPQISVGDAAVNEGNAGTVNLLFPVTLTRASDRPISVSFSTHTGTAQLTDFTAASGRITIPAGATSATVAVTVNGDALNEADETLLLTLDGVVGATIDRGQAVGSILNDDPLPTLTIGNVTITEGDAGSANATLTVTLSAPSGRTVSVTAATVDGSATAPGDYTATSSTLSFAPGVLTQQVVVPVAGDLLDENDETFDVALSSPLNAVVGGAPARVTINDNDPLPSLRINDITVTEGDSSAVTAAFTVTLSQASGRSVSVAYATATGSAGASDFTATSGTLTIPAGQTTGQISVPVLGDTMDEPAETFVVNLSSPANATIFDGQGQATITDNDPTPSFSINNISVTEGNSGTTNAVFTVTLSNPSSQTLSVNYSTSSGTATSNSDFTPTSGTLQFTSGQVSRQVTVSVLGDTNGEDNETFNVNLSNASSGSTIADNQGVATILDDEPRITVADVSVNETNATTTATITVTLSATSTQSVTVNYATASNTATTSDYTTTSGTLTFNAGQLTRTFTIPIAGDTLDEPDETFFVNLSNAQRAVIADSQAVVTIVDNDPTPSLSINDVTVTETTGNQTATFTVTLSAASGQTVQVNYATADNTASAALGDYQSTSGTLSFTAGQTTRTITVTIPADTNDELNETFFVNLSAPVNATISDAQGLGTIVDNDGVPSISIANTSVTEGTGTVNAVFTVSLSGTSFQNVSVNYTTANGSATAPSDFTATSGTLTFLPGQSSLTISVPIPADTLDEPDTESFSVNLSGAVNATISDSSANGTITDNDPTPSLSINDASIQEGNSGTRNLVFTVTLSAASARTVTVSFGTNAGTASAAAGDYVAQGATLTFNPGVTTQTISIVINGDTTRESNETFTVTLSNASNATISDNSGTGTILNDD